MATLLIFANPDGSEATLSACECGDPECGKVALQDGRIMPIDQVGVGMSVIVAGKIARIVTEVRTV
jgi:hypothetical protein